jgi:hypothetical protein
LTETKAANIGGVFRGAEDRLRQAVTAARPRLEAISQDQSGVPRSEGKWSPREIVGHLVDSASNNHGRFVRAQFTDDLLFAGYDQVAWVACQRYSSASWLELVALWAHLNLHLARVMEACPPDARSRPRKRHNLHEVAFRGISPAEPATLEYFMGDYVDHLEHHLAQILGGPAEAAATAAGEPGA